MMMMIMMMMMNDEKLMLIMTVMMVTRSRMINIWLRMIDDHSMDAKFHDLAERDRQTERQTDGAMDGRSNGRTETLAYWDAMDASKNAGQVYHFETFLLLSFMVKYFCYQLMSGALSRVW